MLNFVNHNNPYKTYKPIEDNWLLQIPKSWIYKKLQFGTSILNSNVDKKINEKERPIKLCNYTDVYYNDFIKNELDYMIATASKEEIEKFKLSKDDVIITKDSEMPDDIGIPAYIIEDLKDIICGYHLAILKRHKSELYGKFLFYYLKSSISKSQFEIRAKGVTRFGLSYNAIKTITLPYPPLPEQKTIAKFLDQKTAKIDALITEKEKLLKLLAEKRTALITQAVTKGLNPHATMKDSGIDWLGEIPKDWKIKKIKFISSFIGSGKTPRGGAEVYLKEGIILIRSQNVYDDKLRLKGVVFIDELMDENLSNTRIKEFDILLNITGASIGRCNYIPKGFPKANVNQHVCIIRPVLSSVNYVYLHKILISKLSKAQILSFESGSSREGLNFKQVGNLIFPLPSLKEQLEIMKYLNQIINTINSTHIRIKDGIEKLKEYRTALITAAVTGKIDVRKEVE